LQALAKHIIGKAIFKIFLVNSAGKGSSVVGYPKVHQLVAMPIGILNTEAKNKSKERIITNNKFLAFTKV
jgi:hypothetical protein